MIVRVDARLREEAETLRLRFRCEECAAFDADRAACVYGYPTEPHRGIDLARARDVLFCKAFEVA